MSDDLKNFIDNIKPFKKYYNSYIVKILCYNRNDTWHNICTSLVLDPAQKEAHKANSTLPKLENAKLIEKSFDLASFNKTLKGISNGTLKMRDLRILYKRNIFNDKEENYNQYYHPSDPKVSKVKSFFSYNLNGTGTYVESLLDSGKRDFNRELKACKIPYDGLEDLVRSYFDALDDEGYFQDSKYFIKCPLYIKFSSKSELVGDLLKIKIHSMYIKGTSKIGIGIIQNLGDGESKRIRHEFIHNYGDDSEISKELKVLDPDSVKLFLSFDGLVVDSLELYNKNQKFKNPRYISHCFFDNSSKIIIENLTKKRKKGRKFESAVHWLMYICGFNSVHYGNEKRIQNEIDIIAHDGPSRTLLAIECTTDSPEISKMEKLSKRAHILFSNFHDCSTLKLVATSVPESEIQPSVLSKAISDGIILLYQERLLELYDIALENKTPYEIIAFLKNHIIQPNDYSINTGLKRW